MQSTTTAGAMEGAGEDPSLRLATPAVLKCLGTGLLQVCGRYRGGLDVNWSRLVCVSAELVRILTVHCLRWPLMEPVRHMRSFGPLFTPKSQFCYIRPVTMMTAAVLFCLLSAPLLGAESSEAERGVRDGRACEAF